jgi:lipid-A-disaccharide synthase
LSRAEIAVVTSGTATLEAALLGVPQIVVYKTSRVTYLIAKYLVSIPYISLVNILLNRKLVVELIQKEFSSENIEMEVKKLMKDTGRQKKISEGYSEIRNILGDKVASSTASKAIYDLGRS